MKVTVRKWNDKQTETAWVDRGSPSHSHFISFLTRFWMISRFFSLCFRLFSHSLHSLFASSWMAGRSVVDIKQIKVFLSDEEKMKVNMTQVAEWKDRWASSTHSFLHHRVSCTSKIIVRRQKHRETHSCSDLSLFLSSFSFFSFCLCVLLHSLKIEVKNFQVTESNKLFERQLYFFLLHSKSFTFIHSSHSLSLLQPLIPTVSGMLLSFSWLIFIRICTIFYLTFNTVCDWERSRSVAMNEEDSSRTLVSQHDSLQTTYTVQVSVWVWKKDEEDGQTMSFNFRAFRFLSSPSISFPIDGQSLGLWRSKLTFTAGTQVVSLYLITILDVRSGSEFECQRNAKERTDCHFREKGVKQKEKKQEQRVKSEQGDAFKWTWINIRRIQRLNQPVQTTLLNSG